MSDDTLLRAKARAARVKELAECDGGLWEIFDAVEKNYLETWMKSDVEGTALREKVWHRVNAIRDIRKVMETAIAKGSNAQAIIDKLSQANTGRKRVRSE